MSADEPEWELEPEISEEEREEYEQLISKLKARCESAGIRIEEESGLIFDQSYCLYFPEKRNFRSITIYDIEDAESIYDSNFENINFIETYQSFCSYEKGTIIAKIVPIVPDSVFPPFFGHRVSRSIDLLKKISPNPDGEKLEDIRLNIKHPSILSKYVVLTLSSKIENILLRSRGVDAHLSLRIHGLNIPNHDDAIKVLEAVSDSLFLQIESETGIALTVARSSDRTIGHLDQIKRSPSGNSYVFPNVEYNRDPMIFYWYGVGAYQMPLMQFLAFYQAIEYFYPLYSEYEIKRAIQGVLKSPGFRVDRDSDIARLYQTFKGGRGSGSELAQLRATLKECVNEAELIDFIKSVNGAKDVLSSKKPIKAHRVNLESPSVDIIQEISRRIYEIRCRIVHTKVSDADMSDAPLLPYTTEERNLGVDIRIIKFLSVKVISHSASSLIL